MLALNQVDAFFSSFPALFIKKCKLLLDTNSPYHQRKGLTENLLH